MSDAINALKGILGDDAEDKIKNVMDSLSSSSVSANDSGNSLDYVMQMKEIMDKLNTSSNDPRSNLLMSLKPYMRASRQASIDNAIKIFNLTKLASLFK